MSTTLTDLYSDEPAFRILHQETYADADASAVWRWCGDELRRGQTRSAAWVVGTGEEQRTVLVDIRDHWIDLDHGKTPMLLVLGRVYTPETRKSSLKARRSGHDSGTTKPWEYEGTMVQIDVRDLGMRRTQVIIRTLADYPSLADHMQPLVNALRATFAPDAVRHAGAVGTQDAMDDLPGKHGPTETTRKIAESSRRYKRGHPRWTYARVAAEVAAELRDSSITEESIRNAIRAMRRWEGEEEWKWD